MLSLYPEHDQDTQALIHPADKPNDHAGATQVPGTLSRKLPTIPRSSPWR